MPLRELPTESDTADALLRTEQFEHRLVLRRSEWQPAALVSCALAATTVLLAPAAQDDCYLWRSSVESDAGRRLALAVPLLMVVLVVADRLLGDGSDRRPSLRNLGAIAIAVGGLAAWAGLANQGGREACGGSPAALAFVGIVLLATVVAALWARRSDPARRDIVGPARSAKDDATLSQPEIHSAFELLARRLAAGRPPVRVRPLVPVAVAATAAVALASGLMPWLELIDPAAIDPVGPAPGVIRTALWQAYPAETWRWVGLLTTVATLAVAILMAAPGRPAVVRLYGRGLLAAAAAGTGAVLVTGTLMFLVAVPARLPDGVGYRAGYGVWLALVAGASLLALGILPLVTGGGRTLTGARRWVGIGAAGIAVAAGTVAGLTGVRAVEAPRHDPVAAGTPYVVLELPEPALVDQLGTRLRVRDHFSELFATSLDGSSDLWLFADSSHRETTVYLWRDGIALPRTQVQRPSGRLEPIGVAGDVLLMLVTSRSDDVWAVVSVPLGLRQADLSLEHRTPDGAPYVSPGVAIRARGNGTAAAGRSPDGSVTLASGTQTWRIPPDRLAGTQTWDLTAMKLAPAPGAAGTVVLTAPDGSTAWPTGSDGLTLAAAGAGPQGVVGPATPGCPISSSPISSPLSRHGFNLDAAGNVWLRGDDTHRAVVRTRDGVLRLVPGITDRVDGFHPQPDGSMLVATSGDDTRRLLRIDGAADAAATYPAAPAPTGRCDRTKAPAASMTARVERLPVVPMIRPPVQALSADQERNLTETGPLVLGPDGKVARIRLPGLRADAATDGVGGLWWGARVGIDRSTGLSGYSVVHIPAGARTALTLDHPSQVPAVNRDRAAGAYGDRFVAALGGGRVGIYGPGRAAAETGIPEDPSSRSLVLSGHDIVLSTGSQLLSIGPDGRRTTLLGRPGGDSVQESQWPLATALAARRPASEWSNRGSWFRGPDGKVWGYDDRYLYRIDGPGRATLLAGPEQRIPAAAEVTVIGSALYFQTGADVVRVTLGAAR